MIYLAGHSVDQKIDQFILNKTPRLISYYHALEGGLGFYLWSYIKQEKLMKDKVDLFLDSGAFSAFTQGVEIDIDEYISFIKKNKKYLSVYANLDAIGDPEKTLENQKYMESKGLKPLPCFHYGENLDYLYHYLDNYKYIALGGMVPISTKDLSKWLDDLFVNHLCDKNGKPKVKVHGFGLTVLKLLTRYPWYSVDSTSWVMTGRLGKIYIPKKRNGKYIYDENCWNISVSSRSPSKKPGEHIDTVSEIEQEIFLEYIHQNGFVLGDSYFHAEEFDYELKENEKWYGPEHNGMRQVEELLEVGLCNDYRQRDRFNIIYFENLEKYSPKWPWNFKHENISTGFGL